MWGVLTKASIIMLFLAHLVYQPKSPVQSCFVRHHRWHCPLLALVLALLSVHTSPCHRVRHRNFIFDIHMHMCPPYMHIRYLVILTCSFYMGSHFDIFLWFATGSHRDFISHVLTYLFFTFIHKRTYFLKFMIIFLKFIYSLLLTHVFWHVGSLRLKLCILS